MGKGYYPPSKKSAIHLPLLEFHRIIIIMLNKEKRTEFYIKTYI